MKKLRQIVLLISSEKKMRGLHAHALALAKPQYRDKNESSLSLSLSRAYNEIDTRHATPVIYAK